jgi:hypothetical protein
MSPIRPRRGPAPALGKKPEQVIEQRFQNGPVALDYRCALYRAGLRLDLATDQGEWLTAMVRLKPPVAVHLSERLVRTRAERRFTPWALDLLHVTFQAPASGHPDYLASEEDPFVRAWAFALRAARIFTDHEAALAQLEQVRQLLATAARAVVERCQPAALAVARRFHPLTRLYVYRLVAGDVTGRVAQLARSCPGALVFAAGLETRGGIAAEAARALIQDVVAGQPLAHVLRGAVEQFLLHEAVLAEEGRRGVMRAGTLSLLDGDTEALERWIDRMRLFVRRAGPRVSPLDLCAAPPALFAPEDIPVEVRANARWYEAMRVAEVKIEADVPAGFWSFLSRNALLLHGKALARVEEPLLAWEARGAGLVLARRLLAYAEATRRWPTRHTSAVELLASTDAWWHLRDRRTGPAQRLGEVLERLRRLELGEVEAIVSLGEDPGSDPVAGIVFPVFEAPVVEVAGVELQPIRTALELAAEGHRMGNCVAGLCGQLARGGHWILSGRILTEPVTVQVSRIQGCYVLEEARGSLNRKLARTEWRLLHRWLRALDAPLH